MKGDLITQLKVYFSFTLVSPLKRTRSQTLNFVRKLASHIPPPRIHLKQFHAIYTTNTKYRRLNTPSKRGKRDPAPSSSADDTSHQ